MGPVTGEPPAAAAYDGDRLLGYLFRTEDVVDSRGYSGKPLNVLVGLDIDARITGAALIEHHEPILIIGISDQELAAFVAQYKGRDVRQPIRVARRALMSADGVDAVSGATISSVVINDAILRAARIVAAGRGLVAGQAAGLAFHGFRDADWPALLDDGSLVRLSLSLAQVEDRLGERGGRLYPQGAGPDQPDLTFIDLFGGLATPATVGRNLLGDRLFNRVMADLAEGDQLLFVAGLGLYSFKGTAYVRSGKFDRLQLVQGERTLHFSKDDHIRVEELALPGAPELREMALFTVRQSDGFDPAEPWVLELLVEGDGEAGEPVFARFSLPYTLPQTYRAEAAPGGGQLAPLWQQIWSQRIPDVAVLVFGLIVLSGILVFQDAIASRRKVWLWVRYGFLTFTLLWLGWYAGAQLSVLNVLTFAEALRTEFHWDFFLLEPLLFVLWGYVAATLLFWGRGVFCGWLCPFGALQELLNRLGRLARIPQLVIPFALHERLWPIKYVIFLGLFALSLGPTTLAQTGAEVEPFKTAVVLRFAREWQFVIYALVLLGIGLFIQRFFCRYLCPLGGALAIPARLRMFEWLKRRWHCGTQCQQCAAKCPVQAIHPTGQINPNECVHCLHCQVMYYDDQVCPPLIERRKRRERRRPAQAATTDAATAGGS